MYTAEKNKVSKSTRDSLDDLLKTRVEIARREDAMELTDSAIWALFRAKRVNHEEILRVIGFTK
jgi:hypothetical protein